jgi:hypothetical protein
MVAARRSMLAACAAFTCSAPLAAAELELGGLTFSDELGGIELQAGWGSGTLEDPFVLVESITGRGPAILVVRGMSWRFGNRIRSHHEVGFALTKIVHNQTGLPWTQFEVELRETLERPSPFGDGLSFGQSTRAGRPFRSVPFAQVDEVLEPYDAVVFSDGVVAPGETATVEFVITDTTPRHDFFLLQRRDSPVAAITPAHRSLE